MQWFYQHQLCANVPRYVNLTLSRHEQGVHKGTCIWFSIQAQRRQARDQHTKAVCTDFLLLLIAASGIVLRVGFKTGELRKPPVGITGDTIMLMHSQLMQP